MTKSLYHLGTGDAFVLHKGNNIFSVSFVNRVVEEFFYEVRFELLVNDIKKTMAVYEFKEEERIYNPESWFKNPTIYGETRSLNEKDEQAMIRRIFDYELRIK